MPTAKSGQHRIHYQIEGSGQRLVLYHWSLTTLDAWYELSYIEKLKSKYQIILLDALGHGKSDKPHGPEYYTLKQRVDDLIAVLDTANIKTAHFYGFSMGGWVGFGLAKYVPERFNSIMIGGAHCFKSSMQSMRNLLLSGIENGMISFLSEYESFFGEQTPDQRKVIMQFDLNALLGVAQDRKSLEIDLPLMAGSKCLFLVGEDDESFDNIKKCHHKLSGSTLITLLGIDHGGLCVSTDLVVSNLVRFIEKNSPKQ